MLTFLVIDDQSTSRKLIGRLLIQLTPHAIVEDFFDAEEALDWCRENPVDLVLVDYSMPGMNGVEFTEGFRRLPQHRDVPLVMITINEDEDVRLDALEAGATDFLNKPLDHFELRARCQNLLTLRRHQQNTKERAAWLEQRVSEAIKEVEEREKDMLRRLRLANEQSTVYTPNHATRVTKIARLIGEYVGMNESDLDILDHAAPMHDIGKSAIPESILMKSGELSDGEYDRAKQHSEMGYQLLKDSPSRYLKVSAQIALHHHERYDGTGYPHGLAGEQIPLPARIVAIVDVLDALVSKRPYRDAWPLERAMQYIKDLSGQHFDPRCVDALLSQSTRVKGVLADHPNRPGKDKSRHAAPVDNTNSA